jgi:hypothetical protein
MEFQRTQHECNTTTTTNIQDANIFHMALGHPSDVNTKKTASDLKIQLVGTINNPCGACAHGKGQQMKINKTPKPRAAAPGDKVHFDLSTVNLTSAGGATNWIVIVDDHTHFKWSLFIKRKSELPQAMMRWMGQVKADYGLRIKSFRCDNAGENKSFKQMCDQQNNGVRFEFTAPNTPQQNGVAERAIAYLAARGRATMHSAGFGQKLKAKLWAETFNTVTRLSNIIPDHDGTSAHAKLTGSQPAFATNLHPIGEICYVTDRTKHKKKLDDRAIVCVMVGYESDHRADTFRLYNPNTQRVILSRDVKWARKTWDGLTTWDRAITTKPPTTTQLTSTSNREGNYDIQQCTPKEQTTAPDGPTQNTTPKRPNHQKNDTADTRAKGRPRLTREIKALQQNGLRLEDLPNEVRKLDAS